MHRIVILLVALTPALAHADKTFTTGKGLAWDCKKDPVVNINHGKASYTFKGACKAIHINGGKDTLTIDTVDELDVNGGSNTIKANKIGQLNLNGASNTVTVKTGTPAMNVSGKGNKVNGKDIADGASTQADDAAGGGGGGDADAKKKAPPPDEDDAAAVNASDCSKKASTTIADNGGSYTFTGTCDAIAVTGNDNKVKVESVKSFAMAGNGNSAEIGAADKISVPGNDNKVTYKKGISGAKPKVSTIGNGNKVTQAK